MADQPEDDTFSMQIANQIINIANARIQEGAPGNEVALGLRHAAANFSAFAEHHRQASGRQDGGDGDNNFGRIVEEFASFLEYYLERHGAKRKSQGGQDGGPAVGLAQLVKQVKDEL
jgi:hypothetical protein